MWMQFYTDMMRHAVNSRRVYLEPHESLFESSGRKYIWIILPRSNTNDSSSGFHMADCNFRQCQLWCAAWSEFISTVCRMAVYGTQSWKTAIVWNQPMVGSQLVFNIKTDNTLDFHSCYHSTDLGFPRFLMQKPTTFIISITVTNQRSVTSLDI